MRGMSTWCSCLVECVQAISVLHSLGVIHGDIKPSNALWDVQEECVKLIDFGNAAYGPEWEGGMAPVISWH